MTAAEIDAVVDAWRDWDRAPKDPMRVGAMERACAPLADHLGCTTTAVRGRLAELRRVGVGRRDAVLAVLPARSAAA